MLISDYANVFFFARRSRVTLQASAWSRAIGIAISNAFPRLGSHQYYRKRRHRSAGSIACRFAAPGQEHAGVCRARCDKYEKAKARQSRAFDENISRSAYFASLAI
jgi:hypothetical protein